MTLKMVLSEPYEEAIEELGGENYVVQSEPERKFAIACHRVVLEANWVLWRVQDWMVATGTAEALTHHLGSMVSDVPCLNCGIIHYNTPCPKMTITGEVDGDVRP